jgi:3-polyprenyl-4-hydroxybenzoate decarboxylase
VTDRDVDLTDFRATLECVLQRTRPETDLYVLANLSMDTLDYTGPAVNRGSKGVWLGVGDPVRELPREFSGAVPSGCRRVRVFCGGCLVVEGPGHADDPGFAEKLSRVDALQDWPMVVVVDDVRKALSTTAAFLWTTFTRFDPASDIFARQVVQQNHLGFRTPVVFDARMKPGYPDELHCDPETAATVSRRWREYFPGGGVEMGDSERGHLDGW